MHTKKSFVFISALFSCLPSAAETSHSIYLEQENLSGIACIELNDNNHFTKHFGECQSITQSPYLASLPKEATENWDINFHEIRVGSSSICVEFHQYEPYKAYRQPCNEVVDGSYQLRVPIRFSDISLKDNIEPITDNITQSLMNLDFFKLSHNEEDSRAGLSHQGAFQIDGIPTSETAFLQNINLYQYTYNGSKRIHYGVIAQSLEAIYPDLVYTLQNGIKVVDYQELSILTLKSLVESQSELQSLKKEFQKLRAENNGLKNHLLSLENEINKISQRMKQQTYNSL